MSIFKPAPKPEEAADARIKKLEEQLTQMAGIVNQVQQGSQQVMNQMNVLSQSVQQSINAHGAQQGTQEPQYQSAPVEKVKTLQDYSPDELAVMSDVEKMAIMQNSLLDQVKGMLTESVTPLQQQIESVNLNQGKQHTQNEVRRLSTETGAGGKLVRPDFRDWIPEMMELQKTTAPNASVEQLYLFAKASKPEKSLELDKKYNPTPETDTPAQDSSFGGLLSNVGPSEHSGDLGLEDAAKEAFGEYIEENGSLPTGEPIN